MEGRITLTPEEVSEVKDLWAKCIIDETIEYIIIKLPNDCVMTLYKEKLENQAEVFNSAETKEVCHDPLRGGISSND